MNRIRVSLVAATAAFLLTVSVGPSSAVEIGSRCLSDSEGDGVLVQTIDAPNGPTYVSPINGVITAWGTNLGAPLGLPLRLKLVVPGTLPSDWLVTGEGPEVTTVGGLNVFQSRIPVTAGTRIALFSSQDPPRCTVGVDPTESTAYEKFRVTDVPIGQELDVTSTTAGSRLAVFATIEPDVDADGFGDESQDLCPKRADMQTACPAAAITKARAKPDRRKPRLKLLVTTNTQASVKLTGSARLPKIGSRSARTIRFKSSTRQSSTAGVTSFTVNYPAKLRAVLKSLTRKKRVKLTFKLTATGLIDSAAKTYRTSLRGQAR